MAFTYDKIEPEPEPAPSRRRAVLIVVLVALLIFMVGALIYLWNQERWILSKVDVDGMYPTIKSGEMVLIDASPNLLIPVDAIVAVRMEDDDKKISVKRVIALGGQKVAFQDNRLVVDNDPLSRKVAPVEDGVVEDTLVQTLNRPSKVVPVPKDEYFVIGDNWGNGLSSFDVGPVNRGQIMGRVTKVVWPYLRRRELE